MDFSVPQSDGLETVRVLHQTIVSLRAALEQSKNEISKLKSLNHLHLSAQSVESVVQSLSIENYILRRHIADKHLDSKLTVNNLIDAKNNISEINNKFIQVSNGIEPKICNSDECLSEENKSNASIKIGDGSGTINNLNECSLGESNRVFDENAPKQSKTTSRRVQIVSPIPPSSSIHTQTVQQKTRKLKISIKAQRNVQKKINSRSLESLTILKAPPNQKISFQKTVSFSNLSSVKREFNFIGEGTKNHYKIMTDQSNINTNKTTRPSAPNQSSEETLSPQNDLDQEVDDIELIFTTDETKDQDLKEELVPIDIRESNSNLLNLPLSDIDQVSDRELEDDDVFNDDDADNGQILQNQSSLEIKRDNSLLLNSHSDNSINHETTNLKSCYSFQDSSFENKSLEKDESFDRFEEKVRFVETDISKCGIQEIEYVGSRRNTCPNPLQYKPLAHRESISKGCKKSRPILTHSTNVRCESEAQTDISALPGSSWKSESSLAHKVKIGENVPTLPSKYPMPGSRLKLSQKTVEARRVLLSDIGFTSMVPELSRSADHLCPTASGAARPPSSVAPTYGQYLKANDTYSVNGFQKCNWNMTATPSDSSQTHSRYSGIYPLSPSSSSRRCSVPVSPSKRSILRTASSKVRFANGSLPELRSDWSTVDSGDSTDSLVDEAENFLRRSIDCIVTNKGTVSYGETKRTVPRRASAPEPSRDNIPPQGWQPFLPRVPRDLKLDNWVKVITPESRVRGGRVRYVGPIASQDQEVFVGVQLASPEGICDGIYNGKRYFNCEPCHGIFVPFKKVIMGWKP